MLLVLLMTVLLAVLKALLLSTLPEKVATMMPVMLEAASLLAPPSAALLEALPVVLL